MTIVYKDDGQGGKVCSISSEISYLNCCIKSIKYNKILEIQCSLLRKCINYASSCVWHWGWGHRKCCHLIEAHHQTMSLNVKLSIDSHAKFFNASAFGRLESSSNSQNSIKITPQIDIISEFNPRIWDPKSIQFEELSFQLKFKFSKNIWRWLSPCDIWAPCDTLVAWLTYQFAQQQILTNLFNGWSFQGCNRQNLWRWQVKTDFSRPISILYLMT